MRSSPAAAAASARRSRASWRAKASTSRSSRATRTELEATAKEIAAETDRRIIPLAADVTSREQVGAHGRARRREQLGGLHILVNSGSAPGGSATATGPIETVVDEELLQDFNIKYMGALRCARAAIPLMKKQGWGRIINISGANARNAGNLSGGARNVAPRAHDEDAGGAARPYGITVNCIHPGTTRTERTPSLLAARASKLGMTPEEVEKPRLRPRLAARQRHLPHGGRVGDRVRHGLPGVGQSVGGHRRAGRGDRRRRAVGVLLIRPVAWGLPISWCSGAHSTAFVWSISAGCGPAPGPRAGSARLEPRSSRSVARERARPPAFLDDTANLEVNLNTSGNFNDTNINKRGLTINVRTPGPRAHKRLIAISDVVIENFSSRVLQNWGLGYDSCGELKPDIIYVSMAGFGHTGRTATTRRWARSRRRPPA